MQYNISIALSLTNSADEFLKDHKLKSTFSFLFDVEWCTHIGQKIATSPTILKIFYQNPVLVSTGFLRENQFQKRGEGLLHTGTKNFPSPSP